MFEKRGYSRYVLNGVVNLKINGKASDILKAVLINISFAGISVFLKERLEIGTVVQFELISPLIERSLTGTGKISHVRETKMHGNHGFQLGIKLAEVDKDILVSILNKIEEKICQERRRRWKESQPNIGPL